MNRPVLCIHEVGVLCQEKEVNVLLTLWKKYHTTVPEEYKTAFAREILKDNLHKIFIASCFGYVIEWILFFLSDRFCNTGNMILAFLIASTVLIPLLWYAKRNAVHFPLLCAKIIQYAYVLAALLYSVSIVLLADGQNDFTYLYLSIVFCVTSFVFMMPVESAILLLSVYLVYIVFLPNFQTDPSIVFVTSTNVLALNLFAWIQSRLVLRMKLSSFFNEALLQEKNLKLEDLVKRDTMTGLLTHEASLQRLEEEIISARETGAPLSLIIIDIDDFKKINDNYGHLTGDKVITKISESIVHSVRNGDIVGRYGGEEFIIIMPNTDLEAAKIAALRLHDAHFDCPLNEIITISGGISQYTNETMDDLIRITDKKLYQAKAAGKNCFES